MRALLIPRPRRSRTLLVALGAVALLAATALGAYGAGAPKTVKLSVPANTNWMATAVTLAAGESATITATGTISYGSGWPACQGIPITPDGCAAEPAAPIAGAAGALAARVGAGPPILVGSSGTVTGPGRISLGINDWESELGNNTGAFAVTITRGGAPTPTPAPGLEPLPRPAPGSETARIQAVAPRTKGGKTSMTVTRGGRTYAADKNSILQTGDVLKTGDGTVVALEFLIGGRVGINSGTEVELVNERSVAARGGSAWFRPGPSTQPLEIQTNGGILGIRD